MADAAAGSQAESIDALVQHLFRFGCVVAARPVVHKVHRCGGDGGRDVAEVRRGANARQQLRRGRKLHLATVLSDQVLRLGLEFDQVFLRLILDVACRSDALQRRAHPTHVHRLEISAPSRGTRLQAHDPSGKRAPNDAAIVPAKLTSHAWLLVAINERRAHQLLDRAALARALTFGEQHGDSVERTLQPAHQRRQVN